MVKMEKKMVVRCACCNKYMGEMDCEPMHEHRTTHSTCKKCEKQIALNDTRYKEVYNEWRKDYDQIN